MGPYVLDFYCAKARLAIEIDGVGHDMGEQPQLDARRNAWLEQRGVTVVRITVSELMHGVDDVADAIFQLATALGPRDAPSTALTRGPPPPLRGGGS